MQRRDFLRLAPCAAASLGRAQPAHEPPFPAHLIAENLYFVGNADSASFLITSRDGHVLINSGPDRDLTLLEQSIAALGFRMRDIHTLLISHAHWDHCGAAAAVIRATGARYLVMDRDVDVVESGGRTDFAFGSRPPEWYARAKVDRALHPGEQLQTAGLTLTANLTAGHTKGCTSWSMRIADDPNVYTAVIVGSPYVLSSYRLVANAAYPQIADDYRRGFAVLHAHPCDLFLGAHGSYYGMKEKYARIGHGGTNPFVDPEGYRAFVAETEHAFETELAKQKAARRG
jgi:metallo-beta-lactamase class B